MIDMSDEARKAAENLAISYRCFFGALDKNNNDDVVFWGTFLINDQNVMGIKLLDAHLIQMNIDNARRDQVAA